MTKSRFSFFRSHYISCIISTFCILFTLLLFFVDPEWMFRPPYWDSILGAFREGLWLADNKWDYVKLFNEEPGYESGGAKIYGFSLYVLLISVLYSVFLPNIQAVFFSLHLLNLLAFFSIISMVFLLILRETDSLKRAVLFSLPLISSPLMISQTMAMNMEILIAFCGVLIAFLLYQKQFIGAFAVALFGFAIKKSALIFGIQLLPVLWFLKKRGVSFGPVKLGFLLVLAIIPVAFLAFGFFSRSVFFKSERVDEFQSLLAAPLGLFSKIIGLTPGYHTYFLTEWFAIFFVLSILASLLLASVCFRSVGNFCKKYSRLPHGEEINVVLFYSLTTVLLVHTACAVYYLTLPRYYASFIPLSLIALGILTRRIRSLYLGIVVCIFSFVSFLNLDGKLYSAIGRDTMQANGFVHETTSYRQQVLKEEQRIIQEIEDNHSDACIVASWPYYFMLKEPRLGYVSTRLNVYPWKSDIKDFSGCSKLLAVLIPNVFFPETDELDSYEGACFSSILERSEKKHYYCRVKTF